MGPKRARNTDVYSVLSRSNLERQIVESNALRDVSE
jgi:hypothetical protein